MEGNTATAVQVRPMTRADVPGAVGLQRSCFPSPFPEDLLWNASHLRRHLEIFAEGQFVALANERVVGSASALIVSEPTWEAHLDWETTVGGHFLNAHNPLGTTLYAVDISVHPDYRGRGIGRKLYEARFELVKRLELRRLGTACRLPGYVEWRQATGGSPADYVASVTAGTSTDPTLTPLLRYGLRPLGVIKDYMDDVESANAACLLEWTT